MDILKLSDKGLAVIKKWEGFRSSPYLDAVGVPTIGYGNTYYPNGLKVTMQDPPIIEEQAEMLLRLTVDKFDEGVNKLISGLKQNQFDALVIFSYNVGLGALAGSTLLERIKQDDMHPTIPNEFTKWTRAGGKRLKGLAKRRLEEAVIYYLGYEL